jgi:hypothetical protein
VGAGGADDGIVGVGLRDEFGELGVRDGGVVVFRILEDEVQEPAVRDLERFSHCRPIRERRSRRQRAEIRAGKDAVPQGCTFRGDGPLPDFVHHCRDLGGEAARCPVGVAGVVLADESCWVEFAEAGGSDDTVFETVEMVAFSDGGGCDGVEFL